MSLLGECWLALTDLFAPTNPSPAPDRVGSEHPKALHESRKREERCVPVDISRAPPEIVLFHDLLNAKHPAIAIGMPCVWMTPRHAHYYRILTRRLLAPRSMTDIGREVGVGGRDAGGSRVHVCTGRDHCAFDVTQIRRGHRTTFLLS